MASYNLAAVLFLGALCGAGCLCWHHPSHIQTASSWAVYAGLHEMPSQGLWCCSHWLSIHDLLPCSQPLAAALLFMPVATLCPDPVYWLGSDCVGTPWSYMCYVMVPP